MRYHIGLDVGGTNLSAGVVNEEGQVLSHAVLPAGAGRSIEEITADMAKVSQEAVESAGFTLRDMVSWGIGQPGKSGICICPSWRPPSAISSRFFARRRLSSAAGWPKLAICC